MPTGSLRNGAIATAVPRSISLPSVSIKEKNLPSAVTMESATSSFHIATSSASIARITR
jgi:hypothetical protein